MRPVKNFMRKMYLKEKTDQCLLQFLHRAFFMEHWLNMHDFVMTGVLDEPMNIPKLLM